MSQHKKKRVHSTMYKVIYAFRFPRNICTIKILLKQKKKVETKNLRTQRHNFILLLQSDHLLGCCYSLNSLRKCPGCLSFLISWNQEQFKDDKVKRSSEEVGQNRALLMSLRIDFMINAILSRA